MQVYLVGGAIRDELLGLRAAERDWVVVGATPELMQSQGYRAVGREFPVFLHPVTNEEYALARLERKVAPGYRGFVTEFSPQVTLEEDLQRRDLTVNAIARAADGALIDPFGGQADLHARLLRHVSAAFVEDPVRILRVARFAARFAELGFRVAPETLGLMRSMVDAGEARALVAERVWRELERALGTSHPERFFQVLQDCGALGQVLPEIDALLRQAAAGVAASAALQAAVHQGSAGPVRWAAMLTDLDAGARESLGARLRTPNEYSELLALTSRLEPLLHAGAESAAGSLDDPERLLGLLEAADAFRRPERFASWLQVLAARATASGLPPAAITTLTSLLDSARTRAAAARLDAGELEGLRGSAIAARLRAHRLAALR
jgi:tRNA nucleotidyltransferase (CCA-adding enzyme)